VAGETADADIKLPAKAAICLAPYFDDGLLSRWPRDLSILLRDLNQTAAFNIEIRHVRNAIAPQELGGYG
jgi:hypothetical protein